MSEQSEGGLAADGGVHALRPGRTIADTLALADAERRVVTWMLRRGEVHLEDVVAGLGQDRDAVLGLLVGLVEQGFVRERESPDGRYFRAQLAPTRPRRVPGKLWRALDDRLAE
jgi:hypothetical protein